MEPPKSKPHPEMFSNYTSLEVTNPVRKLAFSAFCIIIKTSSYFLLKVLLSLPEAINFPETVFSIWNGCVSSNSGQSTVLLLRLAAVLNG